MRNSRIWSLWWNPVPVVVLAASCTNGGDSVVRERAVSREDSAGIEIVESAAPVWGAADAWTLDPEPVVEIGVIDGDAAYQLFDVAGARRLSDGTIAVAVGDSEIRFYGPGGRYLRTFGREGEGPGEFTNIGSITSMVGDTLLVLDSSLRRMTVLTPEGGMARELSMPTGFGVTDLIGMRGGRLLGVGDRNPPNPARTTAEPTPGRIDPPPPSISRRITHLLALDLPSGAVDTVVERAGEERFTGIHTATSMGEITGVTVMSRAPPLARSTSWSAAGDRLVLATNDRMSFDLLDLEGTLLRRVRAPFLDAPLDRARADSAREVAIAALDPENAGGSSLVRSMWELREFPDVLPRYGGAVLSSDGTVWLQPYGEDPVVGGPGDAPTREWFVFDGGGAMLGTVAVPTRTELVQAGPDWVLGLHEDEFDVEYVRLYRILRPGG